MSFYSRDNFFDEMTFSKINFWKIVCILFCIFLLTSCSINGNPVTLQTFLSNLSRSYSALWKLVTAWAYLVGGMFGLIAIFKLKVYGEQRTMMGGHISIVPTLLYLLVSVALMQLPATFSTLMVTTFGQASSTPIGYSSITSAGIFGHQLLVTPALIGLVRLIGLVSFVKGWMILVHVTDQGQHATFGKAVTHIIGGLLLINIVGFGNLIAAIA